MKSQSMPRAPVSQLLINFLHQLLIEKMTQSFTTTDSDSIPTNLPPGKSQAKEKKKKVPHL